ncbi:MAG: folate-binding protein YgfZ [Kordiimonadaceae bacterium]|jgi:tRNA-modifying protein YgfZ|nr:folate-binding protein YgfZ [Kordiimonadaceae bacterium]
MTQSYEIQNDRAVITLKGPERKSLLQGIITNNVNHLKEGVGVYSALLTPQGKFLFDFFLLEKNEVIYLDCEKETMAQLFGKLMMYRLRSNVEITDQSEKYKIITSVEQLPNFDLSYEDPRNSNMGYRAITEDIPLHLANKGYQARRIALGIPEGSQDFIVDKGTILEGHFEQLNGVDFEKGCYVGQEVTARMKYRGKVKKAMLPVTLSGVAPELGTDILNEKGNKIGNLRSSCDKYAIALFRLKDVTFGQQYTCGDITVTPFKPDWLEGLDDD